MIPAPRRPSGISDEARFMQWVYDELVKLQRISGGPGVSVSNTTRGVTISINQQQNSVGGFGGALQLFKITALNDEYLTCRPWNGDPESDPTPVDVNVAFGFENRHSYRSDTIADVDYTFSDVTGEDVRNFRSSSDGVNPEQVEMVTLPWKVGEPIYAAKCDHTGVKIDDVEITWIYVATNRLWANIS